MDFILILERASLKSSKLTTFDGREFQNGAHLGKIELNLLFSIASDSFWIGNHLVRHVEQAL